MMVRIPIGGSTSHFYTIEARQRVGYDTGLQHDAVIIHLVDTTNFTRPAQVIDQGGTNTYDHQFWLPGDVFSDTANGITVCANSATATGFYVTAGLGVPVACPPQADFSQSKLEVDPPRPSADQPVRFTMRLINLGFASTGGIVVTSTIPNNTSYIPGSAMTTQGSVTETSPLVFNVGTYNTPVVLSFDARVNSDVASPTVLRGPVTIKWDTGRYTTTYIAYANYLATYLPYISRQ
jgi:uncharacterized repeat protein (TIGR01451 family)